MATKLRARPTTRLKSAVRVRRNIAITEIPLDPGLASRELTDNAAEFESSLSAEEHARVETLHRLAYTNTGRDVQHG